MTVVKTKELGLYNVVAVETDKNRYQIQLRSSSDHLIIIMSGGCIGEKSMEYWFNRNVEYAQRLLLLVEARDMAKYNQMCYSKTYMMNEPKDGYEDKWNTEKEKAGMIERWLVDLSNHFGKDSERARHIREEFVISAE